MDGMVKANSSSAQEGNKSLVASLSPTSVMATLYGHGTHYDSMAPKEDTVHADDINRIKKELDLLKDAV
jgi:hypothetical protein